MSSQVIKNWSPAEADRVKLKARTYLKQMEGILAAMGSRGPDADIYPWRDRVRLAELAHLAMYLYEFFDGEDDSFRMEWNKQQRNVYRTDEGWRDGDYEFEREDYGGPVLLKRCAPQLDWQMEPEDEERGV